MRQGERRAERIGGDFIGLSLRPALLALVLLLQACAGAGDRVQPVSRTADGDWAILRQRALTAIERACLGQADTGDSAEDPAARRNRLVLELIFAIDLGHVEYERRLAGVRGRHDGRAVSDLQAMDRVAAAAERANTPVGAEGPRPRRRAERDYWRNRILSILRILMRTRRNAEAEVITGRLQLPYESWNACLAWADVRSYEQAGTFQAAFRALDALVAAAAHGAEAASPERQGELPR